MSDSHRKKFDTAGAANYLSLGKSTLEKFRIIGGGPAFSKIGKKVLYDAADLDAWFNRHKRTSLSDSAASVA